MILGTAAYMCPEQARGKPVDKRADIWAFGCVLFEMLSGRAAFEGETVSDTIASILGGEPDWAALPETTPASMRRLLRRCLRDTIRTDGSTISPTLASNCSRKAILNPRRPCDADPVASQRAARAGASVLALVTLMGHGRRLVASVVRARPRPRCASRSTTLPTTDPDVSTAVSPDGRALVFVADPLTEGPNCGSDRSMAVLRASLAGTDGAEHPFWSPDSQSIGFFANGQLKRLNLDRGSVQVFGPANYGATAVLEFGGDDPLQ